MVPHRVKDVLGLSRKFIPTKGYSQGPDDIEKGLERLSRDAHLKAFFAGSPLDHNPPPLYVKSDWRPPMGLVPQELHDRLARFHKQMYIIFKKKKAKPNLLPFQRKILSWLRKHPDWIISNTDKNLGPCCIEYTRYIEYCLKHLCNDKLYIIISEAEARTEANRLWSEIMEWTVEGRKKNALTDMDVKYIRKHANENFLDPHGYFYGMFKVHKKTLSTRPVCSDCASITNPVGQWVDIMLQPIMQKMPTYFKDSFAFKELVSDLVVPIGGRLFTADAVQMYSYIDTDAALAVICPYLRSMEKEFGHYHAPTLIRALEIVMKNNIMKFGDIYVKQESGTAMGKPPAPGWATIFEGLHEIEFLPEFKSNLLLYVRFIDDVFGIWIPTDNPTTDELSWLQLKAEVNNNHGLEWEFEDRSMAVNFLDMTVRIDSTNGSIKTSLYEKPMALYLFIPPHSAHPPGVLTGHIFGNLLRIFRLNSDEADIIKDTLTFYDRFLVRGHKRDVLTPLFLKGIKNARKYIATSNATRSRIKEEKHEAASRRLYLHLEYHPHNPPSHKIQQLFDSIVLHPPGETPLNEVEAGLNETVPIDALTIAYHRAPNFGDKFSYRDISKRIGPPVSSFIG